MILPRGTTWDAHKPVPHFFNSRLHQGRATGLQLLRGPWPGPSGTAWHRNPGAGGNFLGRCALAEELSCGADFGVRHDAFAAADRSLFAGIL